MAARGSTILCCASVWSLTGRSVHSRPFCRPKNSKKVTFLRGLAGPVSRGSICGIMTVQSVQKGVKNVEGPKYPHSRCRWSKRQHQCGCDSEMSLKISHLSFFLSFLVKVCWPLYLSRKKQEKHLFWDRCNGRSTCTKRSLFRP